MSSRLFAILPLIALIACSRNVADEAKSTPAPDARERLTRFATVPLGSEVTGPVIGPEGDFFFNVQHPEDSNDPPFDQATIGVVDGLNMNALPDAFTPARVPPDRATEMSVQTALGSYRVLARQGDLFPSMPKGLGQILDAEGAEILTDSDRPDFNAFVPAGEGRAFLYTNWESLPGGMSRLEMVREGGRWTVVDAIGIDFSAVGGTFSNCFGALSPWGTPLTSEEFFGDFMDTFRNPAIMAAPQFQRLRRHIGGLPNPYRYGYIVEITEPRADEPVPVKHYAMGRYSHENSVVMPDRKTVYLSDDDNFAGFFKFVADQPEDLSRGTLYAAKLTQDRDADGELITDPALAGFDVAWIELAHGDRAQIEGWIGEYDAQTEQAWTEGVARYLTEEDAVRWARGEAADDRIAFLETRRAAEAKGATLEFRKLEGVMINPEGAADGSVPWLYVAISYVNKSMADGEGDIQLERNDCGAVYRLRLDAFFDTNRMTPMVVGGPWRKDAQEYEKCPNESIANPDNLQVLRDGRVIIAEDGLHKNAMIWVFDPR